ncbi:MAG: hypothetical protein AB7O26_09715 [Planctomycetaceae bacterium]
MAVELRWVVDPSPACFHAVDLLLRDQPVANEALAAALADPVAALARELDADAVARSLFLANVVPQSANTGGNRQLASVVLTKTIGARRTEQRIYRINEVFSQLESAFVKAMPDFVDRTRADAAPLIEAWNSHGNGLMESVQRLVEEESVVERADVILVPPLQNGGGDAHLLFNSVRIEVLPAGTPTEIPEVLRLAWLIAQLNADLPMYQGEMHRDRLIDVAAFAMLPAVVTAAIERELIPSKPNPIATALRAWRLIDESGTPTPLAPSGRGAGGEGETHQETSDAPNAAHNPADLAITLTHWWETWQSRRPKWSIALAALDQLLA